MTYSVKLAVVGDTGVGKSSVSERFARGTFTDYPETTIGAAFLTATSKRPTHKVKFNIWDTAGQERYRALVPMYYRHAHVLLIVYDITSRSSYDSAKRWQREVTGVMGDAPLYVIVGNKTDLSASRQVPEAEGRRLAEKHGAVFAEVSAKTSDGISRLLATIADAVPELDRNAVEASGVTLAQPVTGEGGSWTSCCY